jgi:predicted MPP superfamily phosphohydrolase
MATFSWLHFSDLHVGQPGTEERWGPIENKLHADLRQLHARMGCAGHAGWDAVLFTGDLAFKGDKGDYDKLDTKLDPLWQVFHELGCDPVLIAVPGNHDAAQEASAAAESLINAKLDKVWSDDYRQAVGKAFGAFDAWYSNWLQRHKPPKSLELRRNGRVPGDLLASFDKDGLLISMVGLNSAFVDIGRDQVKRKGKLVLLPIQTYEIWPPRERKGPAIMLTHHPRDWLRKEVNFAADIAPQTQFFLHCFGHMHEANQTDIRAAGGKPIRLAQGASLFGMEWFGKDNVERIHGYSGGAIDWDGTGAARLRIWPRVARYPDGGEYYMAPDWAHFELNEEEAIAELLPEVRFPLLDGERARERDLVAKLLRAALSTDSEPEPPSSKLDVLPLINLLASKIPRSAETGALTRQARLAIEHYLLTPDAEGAESLQSFLGNAALGEKVSVSPKFFSRVQERETAWKRYFKALEEAQSRPAIQTLCVVQGTAFIAPQHLLAGLLARMDEDWQTVLDVYDRVVEDRTNALGRRAQGAASAAFDRLQTAQWICWLIWGPSIPACTCYAWDGLHALQLGYGDENFSLPVLNAAGPGAKAGLLHELSSGLREARVAAVPVEFSGRLAWAPTLCDATNKPALTQTSLFGPEGGVAVLLESATKTDKANRSYFTSYQWMMFLVGKKPSEPGGPPRLLRNADYPERPKTIMDREDILGRRLWRNLVPVFVHANLADAEVFERQRAMLVDNALSLLHSLWRQREALFAPDDCNDGIQFFLVAASDYTGCGSEPQYPSAKPLAGMLKERLEGETESGLKDVISVPNFNKAWEPVANHFSTCAMPFMVIDYYTYVERKGKTAGT